ncbi:MAG: ribosome maturation factor RimM [Alphaproteobacteria bacterium]|nr:ribosome maturation factor RimM [Alphaproteobacteria bacterium]
MGGEKNSFKIARIAAAHGIRGEVKLSCFLENPDDIARYNPLFTKQGKPCSLRVTGHAKDHLIVAIDGISDRNAAEILRGTELYADAAKLPAPAENEYYVEDLIGLTAVLEDGKEVGKVTAIHNFGAGDILEIATLSGEELLLPFQAPFVGEIQNGRITVQWPEYIGNQAIEKQ